MSLRTDVSCTLFLSDPEAYEGGELMIETTAGEMAVRLAAGEAVAYPAGTLHRVLERNTRLPAGKTLALTSLPGPVDLAVIAVPYEQVLESLREVHESGKVRMVGLSNADPEQIRLAHAVLGDALVSVQNQFSPAFRSSRPEIDVC